MASSREQELAKDIVVAWLHYAASANITASNLNDAPVAAETIASMYKVIVQAIEETNPPVPDEPPHSI
jgi:hypothetical protein